MRSRGTLWRVRKYEAGAAILELAEAKSEGAAPGPVVIPTPLGDTPLTLEVLVEA